MDTMTIGPEHSPTPKAAESAAQYAQSYFSQALTVRDARIGQLEAQIEVMASALRVLHGDIARSLDVGDERYDVHPATFKLGYLVGMLKLMRVHIDSLDNRYGLALTSLSEGTGPRHD